MRIFLDVGAHVGETVPAALHPRYGFDRVVCFEPVASCRRQIAARYARALRTGGLIVVPAGLSDRCGEFPVYGAGGLGASVYADAEPVAGLAAEVCRFVRASDWFREHISPGDVTYLKLNCEGSEVDIVDDLLASGEFSKISQAMIDFDARKVPSQRHRVAAAWAALERAGAAARVRTPETSMRGPTHEARIHCWLRAAGAELKVGRTSTQLARLARSAAYDLSRVPERDTRLLVAAAAPLARAVAGAILPAAAADALRARYRRWLRHGR
ncbi:MAG TPA: FkbM family methyltransferase [Gemmatimonadaceae bacterium]|nr:FkbM family methyltransferase [Gemmatimonadaceae bacterium]